MYLELVEAAQQPTTIQGRQFTPRVAALVAGYLRADAVENREIERIDSLPRLENAKRSMHHRHAKAVNACLVDGVPLLTIGKEFTRNKRENDITAVAVAMIACGLEDLAAHFRLKGGRV